jgi:hypothetical protein
MKLMLDCKKMVMAQGLTPKGAEFVYADIGRAAGPWGVPLINLNVILCNLG